MADRLSVYRVGWDQALRGLGVRRERLLNVEYVVCSCSDWEQHQLWERFAMYLGLPWDSHNMGLSMEMCRTTFGRESMPIMANVHFADVCGHPVAFVGSESMLTHHGILEEWWQYACPRVHASATPWNFANLVHDMAKRDGVGNYFTRNPRLVDVGLDESRDGVLALETFYPDMSLEDRFAFAERKMLAWGERARAYEGALKAER